MGCVKLTVKVAAKPPRTIEGKRLGSEDMGRFVGNNKMYCKYVGVFPDRLVMTLSCSILIAYGGEEFPMIDMKREKKKRERESRNKKKEKQHHDMHADGRCKVSKK